ncbi:ribonuclease H-like domain-containing protein [Podospora didyma]|uniref:RNA exonuclease 4 n=1 Tax=Podospora didyma TaxID=330526 RepID=A0AAE0P0L2_9PEZI|nr:ribonuclease H-like domain-containing protein [Podospora didyma]
MAPELSSNWKKLQARIKAEALPPHKRKAALEDDDTPAEPPRPPKKLKEFLSGTNKVRVAPKKGRPAPPRHSPPPPSTTPAAADTTVPATTTTTTTPVPSSSAKKQSTAKKPAALPEQSAVAAAAKKQPLPKKKAPTLAQAAQKKMGTTQSSIIDATGPGGVSPSLALWAANNDISPEDVAEAYGLGLKKGSSMLYSSTGSTSAVRPNEGLAPDVEVGKYVAIDCEMVGTGDGGHGNMLARVSIVDFHGRQVYDSFVKPQEKVTDWRTHVSGVSPKHMATARDYEEVQATVAELLKDRILVGHDVKHDLEVLRLDHPHKMIRDTVKFPAFRKYGSGPKPALKVLAQELLGLEIQTGQHSSIEDARVAMLLFRKHKQAFDMEHANRYPDTAAQKSKKSKPKKSKKSKK